MGHGRGAAVGDALAKLLSFAGVSCSAGVLHQRPRPAGSPSGESVWARACELQGTPYPFPEEGYKGAYIRDIARSFVEEGMAGAADRLGAKDWAGLASRPLEDLLPFVVSFAKDSILAEIRRDLDAFGVSFDDWFSEESLYREGKVDHVLAGLREQGIMYDKDGAQWFATSRFGDDKDRVVIKQDGEMTYFASDIAYHEDKFLRGFDRVIDIWGADHHGYIPRMKAVVQALGRDPAKFEVLLVQLVNLLREGQPVAMGKREGEFVTLSEVVREVGKDAARYVFSRDGRTVISTSTWSLSRSSRPRTPSTMSSTPMRGSARSSGRRQTGGSFFLRSRRRISRFSRFPRRWRWRSRSPPSRS